MNISAMRYDATGWVGHNHLRVKIDQQDQQVRVDGWLGSASVHLEERQGRVSGSVAGGAGFIDVNVQVDRGTNGLSYSHGWVGRDHFQLDARPWGGQLDLKGNLGNNRIDVSRQDRQTGADFSGWINPGGGLGESVQVQVYSSQPLQGAAMEAIYPLLSLAGAALKSQLSCDLQASPKA